MSKDNQPDQSRIIGEMFDASNVAQPVQFKNVPGSVTVGNIQLPASQLPTENNGFTSDNIQQPAPTPEPNQESDDE